MSVYLDHASTTKIRDEVFQEMLPYLKDNFENPSSIYDNGIKNKKAINASRRKIAELLNCDANEIFFCSGASEAINWAIKGAAFKNPDKLEIITTKIEHHAVLHACDFLARIGYTIKYVDVDHDGFIDLTQLERLISAHTLMVSVIYANNEIGTIQDLNAIGKVCRKHGVLLHADAVQAAGHIRLDLKNLAVDLLSVSAHKFNGPKGSGFLFIRHGVEIESLIHGGRQEMGMRAGTENTPYIVGTAKALELSVSDLDAEAERERKLSKLLFNRLRETVPDLKLNGPEIGSRRLSGNLNLSFRNIDGSLLSYLLGKRGIYISTGSACNADLIEPSHVLKAIGVSEDYINGTLRITLGIDTTEAEITAVGDAILEFIREKAV